MAFEADILALLKSNDDLNAMVSGIYYQIVPDNPALTAKYIVYTFNYDNGVNHLQRNNEIDIYTLNIVIVAPDTVSIADIKNKIRQFMDNYTDSKFLDVSIQNTEMVIEGEREQFIETMAYRIWYRGLYTGAVQNYTNELLDYIAYE
jgi:hypothetical protein